jgi:hypothetical protein
VKEAAFAECPAVLHAYQQQQGVRKFKPLPDRPNARDNEFAIADAELDDFSSDFGEE